MSAQIDQLTTAVNAAIANETALKTALDAAIAANTTLNGTITTLQADLATAQANAADPADAAAIAVLIQKLTDSVATTNPAN